MRILTEDAEADKNFKKNPCRDIKLSNVHSITSSYKSGSGLTNFKIIIEALSYDITLDLYCLILKLTTPEFPRGKLERLTNELHCSELFFNAAIMCPTPGDFSSLPASSVTLPNTRNPP